MLSLIEFQRYSLKINGIYIYKFRPLRVYACKNTIHIARFILSEHA